MPPSPLTLRQALGLPETPCVALVGAGGKSRALFTLAQEYAPPVVLTTTTHLAQEQSRWSEHHWVLDDPSPEALLEGLPHHLDKRVLITGPLQEGRWTALSEGQWAALQGFWQKQPFPLLVEADGAAQKDLKAPAEHEPALPSGVTHVVVVAGLEALGHPLTQDRVHRLEHFAKLSGLASGDEITPRALARVLAHPQGGRKGLPETASWAVLLVAEDERALAQGQRVAEALWKDEGIRAPVVVARRMDRKLVPLASFRPIAGVVLAAGSSQRMEGKNKLLLPVAGEPMVRHVVRTALLAGLHPVVVVVGYQAEAVAQAIADLPVQTVVNEAWQQGQSTSLKAGLRALPANIGGALFLLADMPRVPPTLLRALVATHAQTLAPIIAPIVDHRRGNPVLFDAATFKDLLAIQGDIGGRALLDRYRVHGVPWLDETTQMDVDTWDDYRRIPDT